MQHDHEDNRTVAKIVFRKEKVQLLSNNASDHQTNPRRFLATAASPAWHLDLILAVVDRWFVGSSTPYLKNCYHVTFSY